MLNTTILNAYLVRKQLYSKEDYIEHKEFRASLWNALFSNSAKVFSERKLSKFYTLSNMQFIFETKTPIEVESQVESSIQPLKEQPRALASALEHMWMSLGKQTYCYNCRALSSATRKRKFGDEIINSTKRIRPKQTSWGCSICKVALCTGNSC
jgi:sulfite reductase alpha subunit-like flavoprotein